MRNPLRVKTPETAVFETEPRPLPSCLLRPYLAGRMKRAAAGPGLFSVFVDSSVDLVMGERINSNPSVRQQLFKETITAFNINLIVTRFVKNCLATLFDLRGLYYWLPFYHAAHLTVYPEPEYNLRVFYLFRLVYIFVQLRDQKADEGPRGRVMDILARPPTTPEYAHLFVVDCFSLVAKSKNAQLLDGFIASKIGKLLDTLTVSERV